MAQAAGKELRGVIASAAAGDEVAFARIVAAYHEDMRRVCVFVARDEALADDAVQAAWTITWRKLDSVRDADRLRPWLVSVAVNEAKKLLKKRQRRAEVEVAADISFVSGGQDPASTIDAIDALAAMDRLDPEDRALWASPRRHQDGDVFSPGEHVGERGVMQRRLKLVLSGHPEIAHRLIEANDVAGGETDLVLGQVVNELKVEHDRGVDLEDAYRYLSQPTHYAAVGHSQVSVLTILDMSAKEHPPGVESNYMGWIRPALHGLADPTYPSLVAAVVIPGNFPRPSDWPASSQTSAAFIEQASEWRTRTWTGGFGFRELPEPGKLLLRSRRLQRRRSIGI